MNASDKLFEGILNILSMSMDNTDTAKEIIQFLADNPDWLSDFLEEAW